MRKVIERKDHTTLVEVQSYVGFVITPWTNIGTPSLQQLNSARKSVMLYLAMTNQTYLIEFVPIVPGDGIIWPDISGVITIKV